LEGPSEAVGAALKTIEHDDRHHDVTVLDRHSVDSRSFPHWSMAFVGAKTSKSDIFSRISAQSGFDPTHFNVDDMLINLHRLVHEEELDLRSIRSRRIWASGGQGWPAGSSATGTGRWSVQKKSFRKIRRPEQPPCFCRGCS
jgi:Sensors of blue-light using FAD